MISRVASISIIIAACLCGLVVGWELNGLSSYTVPVLMWSDKQLFTKSQVTDTVSTEDIDFALTSLFNKNTNKASKISSVFNEDATTPEVVILFVESKLRTDQVPFIASAYGSTPGGSLSHLKSSMEAAKSTLAMPYAAVSGVTLLDQTLLDLIDQTASGNVFMSSVGGSQLFSRIKQLSSVKSVELSNIMSTLQANNAFTNGVADLVIVCFDTTSDFSQHDSIIADLLKSISAKGNYVAAYTANMPSASNMIWTFEEHNKEEFARIVDLYMDEPLTDGNGTGNTTNPNSTHHKRINYFPGPFLEALLVVAILLTMLFTGACAIFSLQTPDKWEAPKIKSREM